MTNQTSNTNNQVFWKTVQCVALSSFYIAMLAWPFGLSEHGYVATRAILAGTIMFAISIPAWIINVKREFNKAEATETVTADAKGKVAHNDAHLAMNS